MIICYSGRSAPSAQLIADQDDSIMTVRGNEGDANWGRARANTQLNPNISNVTNKRVMRQLFAEHDVPMPLLLTPQEVEYTLLSGGVNFVGRPDQHSKGRGLWRIRTSRDFQKALRGTRRKKAATHFMEFIDAPREYRVHIFKGKSIRISEKKFCDTCPMDPSQPSRNCHDYTTVKPQHNVKRVRKAAKRAMEAVGLDFGAVDILARGDNNEEVFVLEVNAAPGLGGSTPRLYADTFLKWIRGEL